MSKLLNKVFSLLLLTSFSFLFVSISVSFAGLNSVSNIPTTYRTIGAPGGVTVMSDGTIWYTDSLNQRIVKINQSGQQLLSVGGLGTGEGQLNNPIGITHDNQGNIYVADYYNGRIDKFDSNGAFLMFIGTAGSGDGQLNGPVDVQFDSFSGTILVTDRYNYRIQRFTKDGRFLSKFGTEGTGDGQFVEPLGLSTDASGRIYVVDSGSNTRVQIFTSQYAFVGKFGSLGIQDNELFTPVDVLSLSDGSILVTVQNDHKVKKFDSNGNYITSLSWDSADDGGTSAPYMLAKDSSGNVFITDWERKSVLKKDPSDGSLLFAYRDSGVADNKFQWPTSVGVDSDSNVFVIDRGETYGSLARIQKFDSNGDFVWAMSPTVTGGWNLAVDNIGRIFNSGFDNNVIGVTSAAGVPLFTFGTSGTGDGQFFYAGDIAFDSDNNAYITDGNQRVQKFDSAGNYLTQWGSEGSGNGQFMWPGGIDVDSSDNVYVIDTGNYRVEKFTSSGGYISSFDIGAYAYSAQDIAIDGSRIYISDDANRVLVFDLDGNFIESVGTNGSGINQFYNPHGITVDKNTHTVYVADVHNHRVVSMTTGVRIKNVVAGLDVKRVSDGMSLVNNVFDPTDPGMDNISAALYFGDHIISTFTVDLTQDRDWSLIAGNIITDASKTVLVNLNPTAAPGISATHSLYVTNVDHQQGVFVCPTAVSINDVNQICSGGYMLQSGNPALGIETVDGTLYWRVDGVTGTGALGLSYLSPAGALTLTPNSSAVSVSQEVVMSYASIAGFVAGDKVQLYFEPTAGFVLTNTCGTPTTDADGDATPDGSATIVGTDVYEYTFSDTVVAGDLSFCAVVQASATAGSYSVRLTDDNGTFDSAMYYVGDDNDVFVIANVAPSLSFNIRTLLDDADTNVCQFGTVSSSDTAPDYDNVDDGAGECGYSLAVGTNAASGFQIQLTSDGALRSTTANLASLSDGGTFSSGVEAYGFANITSATTGRSNVTGQFDQQVTRDGVYNLATNTGAGVPVSNVNFVSFTNGIQYLAANGANDVTEVVHGLVVGSGTPAGYYQQVLTYTVTANF
jgi:sugar lactone lactonase YvrE